jgi:hypothetical protein
MLALGFMAAHGSFSPPAATNAADDGSADAEPTPPPAPANATRAQKAAMRLRKVLAGLDG